MRNTLLTFLLFVVLGLSLSGCVEKLVAPKNCSSIGLLLDVIHNVDSGDNRTVYFSVIYNGEHAIESGIEWNYGDGTSETVSGTTAQHTYTNAGTYTVSTTITLNADGIGSCPRTITEEVFLN